VQTFAKGGANKDNLIALIIYNIITVYILSLSCFVTCSK